MPVLFRIAFRNLWEHRTKTLIVGIIISLGVIILIVGNALMDSAALGIQRSFIGNYTGDVVVTGVAEGDVSLFGVISTTGIEETPNIPEFERVREHLEALDGVRALTSQVTGFGALRMDGYEGRTGTAFFGIEPDTYQTMFDSIEIIEGRYLENGEEGMLISRTRLEALQDAIRDSRIDKITDAIAGAYSAGFETEIGQAIASESELPDPTLLPIARNVTRAMVRDAVERYMESHPDEASIPIHAGDEIIVTSMGRAGIRIRRVPIVGVYDYKQNSEGLGLDLISYLDVQTLRSLAGLTVSNLGAVELSADQTNLLSVSDTDSLFSEDAFVVEAAAQGTFTEESLDTVLGDTSVREEANVVDTGAWQYLLFRLDNPARADIVIRDLNAWFAAQNLACVAGNWEVAAGPFAMAADVIRQVFDILVIIVGIVALIIMMNTLVISVIERTSEIGTMRALGARKSFVWKMFASETAVIAGLFGLAGVVLSAVTVLILNLVGIEATDVFLRVIYGGDFLRPALTVPNVLFSLLIVTGVGFLAHLYPVYVAMKIPPVRAIQTE